MAPKKDHGESGGVGVLMEGTPSIFVEGREVCRRAAGGIDLYLCSILLLIGEERRISL